jgi:regulation of enolase protein 1 (concanavalin A-like superfamily)
MKTILIILIVVSIVITVFLFTKKKKSAKYFLMLSVLMLISFYAIRFIPPGIKARIFPEYLDTETISNDKSLEFMNDDFNSDSLNADWKIFNADMIDMKLSGSQLVLTPKIESVWWMKDNGPLIYKMAEGDFSFSTKVKTRKASDTTNYPDKEWQFGGIMLRDSASENTERGENYVFIVVGYRGSKLQVEVKSTQKNKSDVIGINWQTGDAEVRISRKGNLFYMMARKDPSEEWQVMETYNRPDLPKQLQAGIIVYSYSYGRGVFDLTARFDEIKFWKSEFEF